VLAAVLACALAATDNGGGVPELLSRQELLAIAEEDIALWQACFARADASLCMRNKDAESFRMFLPLMGSPFSYEDTLIALQASLTPDIRRMTAWIERSYVGANSVAYVASALYECRNGEVGDNELLMHLLIDPTSKKVVRAEQVLLVDRFIRVLTLCVDGRLAAAEAERPQSSFEREGAAAAAMSAIWNAQPGSAPLELSAIDESIELCVATRPMSECVYGKAAFEALVRSLTAAPHVLLERRLVLNDQSAWASLTDHLVCADGSTHRVDGEAVYETDWRSGRVVRALLIKDLRDSAPCGGGSGGGGGGGGGSSGSGFGADGTADVDRPREGDRPRDEPLLKGPPWDRPPGDGDGPLGRRQPWQSDSLPPLGSRTEHLTGPGSGDVPRRPGAPHAALGMATVLLSVLCVYAARRVPALPFRGRRDARKMAAAGPVHATSALGAVSVSVRIAHQVQPLRTQTATEGAPASLALI
jgi:hypothetical protein